MYKRQVYNTVISLSTQNIGDSSIEGTDLRCQKINTGNNALGRSGGYSIALLYLFSDIVLQWYRPSGYGICTYLLIDMSIDVRLILKIDRADMESAPT